MIKYYTSWIPLLISLCIISAAATHKGNTTGGAGWSTVVVACSVCFGILYAIFTKYARNLMLDNLIYSTIITIVVTSVFAYFGHGGAYGLAQWFGIVLIILGLVIFNIR